MWPLQLTYNPQLLAKYIQSQNINPTNKCFPIVGRINTITIYIYIQLQHIPPMYIFVLNIFWQHYMLYLRVSLFCKTVFVTSGSQFSRGPICRTNIFQGPNLPGPDLPGPNLPPRGPIWHQKFSGAQFARAQSAGAQSAGAQFATKIARGPICQGPNLPRTV